MNLKSITFPGLEEEYSIQLTAEDVGARPDTWMPTLAELGAAPGGYGYGEWLESIGTADDDVAFTATLSQLLSENSGKTKQFRFSYKGGWLLGSLWCLDNKHGTLIANSYVEPNVAYRFKQMVRVCTNGTWGDWVDNSPTAFAPSGYGLGKWSLPVTDLNTCTMCGWYTFGSGCANAPFTYGVVEVINRTDTEYVQIAYDTALNRSNHNGAMAKRVKGNSETAWGEWEFVNPPMALGVEYRTTERWQGKAVYVKLVDFGALPNNTYKDVNIVNSLGTTSKVVDARFRISAPTDSNGQKTEFDMYTGAGGETTNPTFKAYTGIWSNTYGTHVARIVTNADMTGYTATVIAKYTKD